MRSLEFLVVTLLQITTGVIIGLVLGLRLYGIDTFAVSYDPRTGEWQRHTTLQAVVVEPVKKEPTK